MPTHPRNSRVVGGASALGRCDNIHTALGVLGGTKEEKLFEIGTVSAEPPISTIAASLWAAVLIPF